LKRIERLPSKKPSRRLEDILENIERIRQYTAGYDLERFEADRQCRDAVERCLLRISEAARKLEGIEDKIAPDQPWAEMRRLGNVLRHEYDGVDLVTIWQIVTEDLPSLQNAIQQALTRLNDTRQGG
jgi:uncharacterized protein with HEPN domain